MMAFTMLKLAVTAPSPEVQKSE